MLNSLQANSIKFKHEEIIQRKWTFVISWVVVCSGYIYIDKSNLEILYKEIYLTEAAT